MLKPIGLRKKPTAFTQNINTVPMELEFFGVQGTSYEDLNGNSSQDEQESAAGNKRIQSQYSLELSILNEDQVLKKLDEIDI